MSGSVLLVIFGLYQKTLNAISTLFKNFKKNVIFLIPLIIGFGIGVLIFSKVVDFFLNNFEMQTRFTFLGLVLGTIPLFFKEVKKNGFSKKYYIFIVAAACVGITLFSLNSGAFPQIKNPNFLQAVLLGVAVAASSIVPGVDSAVILSTFGLYELYVSSLANLNFRVLIPAGFGLLIGAFLISFIMNVLVKNFYTATFSIIFGLFISIIPSVLNESCVLSLNTTSAISILFLILGFIVSFYLGDIQKNNERIKHIFRRKET
ncbi:MAG: DUF368 domain-containing protein [Candidatus Pseudoruminococcus sp.]